MIEATVEIMLSFEHTDPAPHPSVEAATSFEPTRILYGDLSLEALSTTKSL